MTILVITIFAVISVFIAGVSYLNMQETKRKEEQIRSLNAAVREIQNNFKSQVESLYEAGLLESPQKQRLNSIAGNFFVFQTVGQQSIDNLTKIYDSFTVLTSTILALVNKDEENVKQYLHDFIATIPASAVDCNSKYYLGFLPSSLTALSDRLALLDESDEDNEHEDEVSLTAANEVLEEEMPIKKEQ